MMAILLVLALTLCNEYMEYNDGTYSKHRSEMSTQGPPTIRFPTDFTFQFVINDPIYLLFGYDIVNK